MKAKFVCGTEGASAQPTCRIWVQMCGVLMASKSWGLHKGALSSRKQQRTPGWKRRKNCGQPCLGSLTCNAHGKSSFSAQDFVATICCARCLHPVQHGMRKVMMKGCRGHEVSSGRIASLPMRMGGLGLRSTSRMAVASCWASWADVLPILHGRMPAGAERVTTILAREDLVVGCFSEVQSAARTLDRHGFVGRPDCQSCV